MFLVPVTSDLSNSGMKIETYHFMKELGFDIYLANSQLI